MFCFLENKFHPDFGEKWESFLKKQITKLRKGNGEGGEIHIRMHNVQMTLKGILGRFFFARATFAEFQIVN